MISKVKQISVFIENKVGHLAEATDILAKNDINIRALFVYDSKEYAILRLIVDKPFEAVELFRESGKVVRIKDVMVIEPIDEPGMMNKIFHLLASQNINIDYAYPYAKAGAPYMLVLATSDQEKAYQLINNSEYVATK
ncbi:amino acid-binding protein [Pseudoramibacter sp.]|jgi:hypothetical protein|uniref:amino acid-binding protein n=1 Tax=Pseudoramibacter sp. TaxID=2034862 RepID=UPI0025F806E6|nr:amino acid-binding protein [Pseudoramibacter sp.]MCH4072849.1 amino acid-binding protein [Pseudoramibacter sp.]MCH4106620.1 amino acid-binding protein [Pseudoramibacter sp.]